jgi:C4-dicarboxylate-specific signal transduction histidine kinase
LRTAAQCQGRRDNGELFAAHAWFSSYASPEGNRLAAIIVDSSEELRAREEQGLREMLTGNKILAAAFSHEVRNFCLAMRMLCTSVQEKGAEESGADLQTLVDLVGGMEAVAATQLRSQVPEVVEEISLRDVLDNLRIVVDTQWSDAGGSVRWSVPEETPMVLAEPHGLLQVFMNLTQNSLRAVRDMPEKLLEISVTVRASAAQVRFRDSGPGVPAPKTLFQAFQSGAEGSGLGLYVSRSIVRSYGGDLQYEGSAVPGAVFVVDLQARSSLMTP